MSRNQLIENPHPPPDIDRRILEFAGRRAPFERSNLHQSDRSYPVGGDEIRKALTLLSDDRQHPGRVEFREFRMPAFDKRKPPDGVEYQPIRGILVIEFGACQEIEGKP